MSLKVTQDPPSTVGGGSNSAVAADARFVPVIVMNDPGRTFVVPSLALTMPRAPVAISGLGGLV